MEKNVLMNDKERVEFLLSQMGLSNVEFAARTGMSPATLSHILSGRSKPTLSILRGIIAGFPELSPEWVLMGTGTMYKEIAEQQIENAEGEGSSESGLDVFSFDTSHSGRQDPDLPHYGLSQRMETVVKATVAAMTAGMKKPRKVVEIRLFFDDGTYQEFS